jgi:hypothetical protein
VWIFVAGSTRLKRKTRPTRLLVFSGDVTFGALNLEVHSGQGIARLGVIKAVDLPSPGGMALLALFSETPLVLIGMATGALAWNSQEAAVQILYADRQFVADSDAARSMTLCTR